MSYPCGKIYHVEQGKPEWDAVRVGKISASHMSDVMMDSKKAGYRNYRARMIAERITNEVSESYSSSAMADGIELEPAARSCYEYQTGTIVAEVGFVDHPHIENAGASPDGMVGNERNVEIKCVFPATHIDYMLTKKIPTKYMQQMQWQMACNGFELCDFVSYSPKLGIDLQLLIITVERDADMIRDLEAATMMLNNDVAETIKQLEAL